MDNLNRSAEKTGPKLPTLDGITPDGHTVSLSGALQSDHIEYTGPLPIGVEVSLNVTAVVMGASFKWNDKDEVLNLVHSLKVTGIFDDEPPAE